MGEYSGKTVFISGAGRGIGLAIGVRLAREGASIAFIAKTGAPHPALAGTMHTAAAEIEEAGGRALAIVGDVRSDEQVIAAVEKTVGEFGGIDVVVNKASAIDLSSYAFVEGADLWGDIFLEGRIIEG